MKRLTFLILTKGINNLIIQLVDYLIYSPGHLVEVNTKGNDKNLWLNKYPYDLSIISDDINYDKYDYIIDLEDLIPDIHIAKIGFNIQSFNYGNLRLDTVISTQFGKSIIATSDYAFNNLNLEQLYKGITEEFINALVFLLYSDYKQFAFSNAIFQYSSINEILRLEQQLNRLNLYYSTKESEETPIFTFRLSSINHLNINRCQKFNLKLDHLDSEFLLIYLLLLLNSRQGSVFKYDFALNKKLITKYVHVSPSDNYQTLVNKINHDLYEITNNCLFNSYLQPNSEILLCLDELPQEFLENYKVVINYDHEKYLLTINYIGGLYFFDEIEQYIDYFYQNLIIWKKQNLEINKILCLESEHYYKQLYLWNETGQAFPKHKTVHQLFEEQVSRAPDKLALVYKNVKLTYRELDNKINQLSQYLIGKLKIKPDNILALFLDRSESLVIAMLATLKIGAAYTPIDPKCPKERITYILKETKAKAILTKIKYLVELQQLAKDLKTAIITIDSVSVDNFPTASIKSKGESTNLAYILYTSGTTGKPKGVMIEHRSLVNFTLAHTSLITATDKFLGYINYTFDAINTEIYVALLLGNILHISSESIRHNLDNFYEYIIRNEITILVLPSIIASELLSKYDITDSKLRLIIVGGGVYNNKISIKGKQLINAYGPTETTVCATMRAYSLNDLKTNIGKPIANTSVYILDDNRLPLPIGAVGELYIGGEGLARGYLNQAELTSKSFIHNPFELPNINNYKNSKLYKTGDLVRYLPTGDIEYIGRNDFQIKIRGYRVELGEIEDKLISYPEIIQAIVILQEEKAEKFLVGYFTANKQLEENIIKAYLTKELPAYMVPHKLIQINKIPLTANGKLDKNVLPKATFISNSCLIPPVTVQQKLVCEAFCEILDLKTVSLTDDYFELGGDSIGAIRLVTSLQKNFDIKMDDIFKLRTPQKISEARYLGKNILNDKLEAIKAYYTTKSPLSKPLKLKLKSKLKDYQQQIKNLNFNPAQLKQINNVLLTGASGFLGCNILYQLLTITSYHINILLRASSIPEAYIIIKDRFTYYFEVDLDVYKNRITIFIADLRVPNLNLSIDDYQKLVASVDSIIHAAANVKHYGNYEDFYDSNVQATINLLELARLTANKDFHYMSTSAPLVEGQVPGHSHYIFTEDDTANVIVNYNNLYAKTKYEGETIAVKYREYQVKTTIYRLGNLAFISKHGRPQINLEDNAFYQWLKCLLKLKSISKELSITNITPVDEAALAIVMLFDKEEVFNTTLHIFNPYRFNLSNITLDGRGLLKNQPIGNFIENVKQNLYTDNDKILELFLLRQGWLNDTLLDHKKAKVLQDKTNFILNKVNYKWQPVNNQVFEKYLKAISYLKGNNE